MHRASTWSVLPAVTLLTLAFPAPSLAQARDDFTKFRERETAVWESVQNKRLDAIRKVFDRNYVAAYDAGIMNLAQELDGMSKVTLRSFTLSDVKVHRIDGQNVSVAYKAEVEGDSDGQSMSGTYNNLTIWHRKGNQWWVAAHSAVKAR